MGRSVSHPSDAYVAFAEWGQGWVEGDDDDNPGAGHFDEWLAQMEWPDIVDDFRRAVLEHYPSARAEDRWLGREDRVVAMNDYAWFGLSEYCGSIAYWVVLQDRIDSAMEGLARRWFEQIGPKFEKRFATLERLGSFSNGESVYRRIAA
jgi:hypothetical protein